MKTVIFIDGENFMHQVRDVLYKRRIVRNRDDLTHYDIRALLGLALKDLPDFDSSRGKVLYYSTKVHVSDVSESLKERTENIKAWSEKLKEQLVKQNVDFIEAGHLLVREGKKCMECGHREPVLMEKGVDVQLATDLIRTSGDNVRLILLSSDGDLTPAVVEARRRGSEMIYVGFRGVSNATLGRAAGQRYTINANQVVEVYRQNAVQQEDKSE